MGVEMKVKIHFPDFWDCPLSDREFRKMSWRYRFWGIGRLSGRARARKDVYRIIGCPVAEATSSLLKIGGNTATI